jgi:hypothetical protein
LLALGRPALEYLTELTHRPARIWIRDVDRLHTLLATYGEDALRTAFIRGLEEQARLHRALSGLHGRDAAPDREG